MLPEIKTQIPGTKSLQLAERLSRVESQNITFWNENWPIFWQKAKGANVWDVDGNRYIDLTSAFGVAGLGHRFDALTTTIHEQADSLIHAMGDVHPCEQKVILCEKLSQLTYEKWTGKAGKTILGNSGFEAVEAALKSAVQVTGKPNVITFKNGYHGLGYGALMAGGYEWFREPFESQLASNRHLVSYPSVHEDYDAWALFLEEVSLLDKNQIGSVLIEPIQGRGGTVEPQDGFLSKLREWCTTNDICLIFDEIYTGFHRTGHWFACEKEEVVPDYICLAKALSGGYPISACVGKAELVDAWERSEGEALHTSTFLGNPLGCAMAIISLNKLSEPEWPKRVAEQNQLWEEAFSKISSPLDLRVRGRGLMLGLECWRKDGQPATKEVLEAVEILLKEGVIILPESPEANILAITPTFTMSSEMIDFCAEKIGQALNPNNAFRF